MLLYATSLVTFFVGVFYMLVDSNYMPFMTVGQRWLNALPVLLAISWVAFPVIFATSPVLGDRISFRNAALAYWQGQYVAIDRDEDAVKLAEVSVPASRAARKFQS